MKPNAVLLVACILIGLGTIIYFFFWNRIFAFVLSFLLRLALWSKGDNSGVWVSFGSIHLSLLSGRIMIQDLRYHSSNQTFRIVKCQLSWRWWIRKAAEEEDLSDTVYHGEDVPAQQKAPRCRIHVTIEGFEWFMYNRTYSFDQILSQLSANNSVNAPSLSVNLEPSEQLQSMTTLNHRRSRNSFYTFGRRAFSSLRLPSSFQFQHDKIRQQLPDLNPKNLLPMSFEATKGAITMGNHSVENLFMGEFGTVTGTFSLARSKSKFDLHKQLLRLTFENVVISCIENTDHWGNGMDIGSNVVSTLEKVESGFRHPPQLVYRLFMQAWARTRSHFPYFKSRGTRYISPSKKEQKWPGRGKKRDEEVNHVGADFSKLEYAIDRKLLETSKLELTYSADVAGPVPDLSLHTRSTNKKSAPKSLESLDIGNGDIPPEWVVELVVHGGSVRYGPWADRQRVQIQRIFFPQAFSHGSRTRYLEPGDTRTCTCLKLQFEFREMTSLSIPFREASKNWFWDGKVDVVRNTKQREAGSLQLRLGDKTFVKYFVPMVTTEESYNAELNVFLDNISVSSSLNDIRLLEAKSCKITSVLPSPLLWNAFRLWNFNVELTRPIFNLIRDHINMLVDLGKDWSSGPPSDFRTFIPITYEVCIICNDYVLNLNANDHNVIDRPLEERENVLFSLRAPTLLCNVQIPGDKFRPLSTTVAFLVETPNSQLSLSLPRWNTHALLAGSIKHTSNVGHLSSLSVNGKYTYHAETRVDYVDQLSLQIRIPSPSLKLYGWIIRHAMVLRDNYFGSFTQYSTTKEYLEKVGKNLPIGDPLDLKYRPAKNNVFHLNLSLLVENGLVALPSGLAGYESARHFDADMGCCTILEIPSLQLHLRLHDYAMEMSLNVDPIDLAIERSCTDSKFLSRSLRLSKRKVCVTGIDITANRLFGPQPHTSTYVCVWNIQIGSVKGILDTYEGHILALAMKSFMHGLNDPFNAPSEVFQPASFRDATFLKVSVDSVDVTWQAVASSLRIAATEGLHLSFNNISQLHHRKATFISVPKIELQMLLPPTTGKQWLETFRFETSASIDMYMAPEGWRSDALAQYKFVSTQDKQTSRFYNMGSHKSKLGQHRGQLYMTPVTVPHSNANKSRKSLRTQRNKPRVIAIQERHFDSESESDQEPFVSEFNRDQKLINSRPESVAYPEKLVAPNDESTSSLDESDEAESVSEDTWSVYSEINGLDEAPDIKMRALYWSACRKFRLFHSSSDVGYESRFVSDSKEYPNWHSLKQSNDEGDRLAGEEKLQNVNAIEKSDHIERRYLRIHLGGSLCFSTPLALVCLTGLLSERQSVNLSPELLLDSMILDWLASDMNVAILSSMTYHVTLSNQQYSFVQHVARPAEDSEIMNGSRILSRLCVQDLEVYATPSRAVKDVVLPAEVPCASIEIKGARASMHFLPSSRATRKRMINDHGTIAIDLRCDLISSNITEEKFDMLLGEFQMHLHHDSVEAALLSSSALSKSIKEAVDAWKGSARLSRVNRQHFLFLLLQTTDHVMNQDLLSTIQPVFFVQRGKPHILRQDKSWKLLFHLRHSLSLIEDTDYCKVGASLRQIPDTSSSVQEIPMQQLNDVHVDTNVEILVQSFEAPSVTNAEEARFSQIKSVHIHFNMIRVLLGDISPESSVVMHNLDGRADCLSSIVSDNQVTVSYQAANKPNKVADPCSCRNILLFLALDSIQTTIFPTVFAYLQKSIHNWRLNVLPKNRVDKEYNQLPSPKQPSHKVNIFNMSIMVAHALIEAAAENVVFGIATENFGASGVYHIPRLSAPLDDTNISGCQVVHFDDLIVRIRARSMDGILRSDKDTLAEANFSKNTLSAVFQRNSIQGISIRSTLQLDTVEFNFPRSAIRLYHFLEEWRQDYLSGMQSTIRSLFKEIKQSTNRATKDPRVELGPNLIVDLNVSVSNIAVVMQVMHGTWVLWAAHETVAYLKCKQKGQTSIRRAGLQITSQSFKILSSSPSQKCSQATDHMPKIVLNLPSVSTSVSIDTRQNDLLVSIGFMRLTIKPSHWDALLSVQQKSGQDFNDLLLIISETQRKRPSLRQKEQQKISTPFRVTGKFDGFKIGLEGQSSTQFLECTDINASFSTKGPLHYMLTLNGLSLYLIPKSLVKATHLDRSQLPVMVTIDLRVAGHRSTDSVKRPAKVMVNITKFHAVLQAHLIGEIGDFVDHLQAEVLLRREQRSLELDAFKEKARRVMSTFNVNPRAASTPSEKHLMRSQSFVLSMTNFGLAFPLNHDGKQATRSWTDGNSVTQAFLLSISSVEFESLQGETGEAHVKDFSSQFVSRFNPSDGNDFSAKRHQTTNQMLYPKMTARLNSYSTASSRQISISASISGFILDLDPSVTSYAFSLVDAYRQGKQRMEQFTSNLSRNSPEQGLLLSAASSPPPNETERRVTTALELSMNFQSGTVRMHPQAKGGLLSGAWHNDWRRKAYRGTDSDAEMFFLPELTVWCEYRAKKSEIEANPDVSVLLFKSTVHSSWNTFRPSILPFVTGIVHNIEERMKRVTHHPDIHHPTFSHRSLSIASGDEALVLNNRASQAISPALQIIFSLRIDKSRLEFTCKPDVNVVAGLNWESGGFIFNMSPGARGASISASISGLTASLKHGFLSSNSAHIDARNLNMSVDFSKANAGPGQPINMVSVVVDTEFSGSFKFSRLQDFLCLKAVWLDHIPIYKRDVVDKSTPTSTLSPLSPMDPAGKQGFDTSILFRVRRIAFEADLGQSISVISFSLQTALIRTRLTSALSEIAFTVESVELIAKGNLSGSLRMPDFLFKTIRRRQQLLYESQPHSRMLELKLTTGPLDVQLQSDWLWLLQYRAEPLQASIYDDWTKMQGSLDDPDRQLQLFFSVTGTKVIAMMTIMALPKLIMYAGKLSANLEEQKEGASRESVAFRSSRLPKPNNALSEVANAMLKTAKGKLKESEALTYTISQHMQLKLEELTFIVLPRSQNDTEMARFLGSDVSARLERVVQRGTYPIHRILELSLSRMAISQLLRHNLNPRVPTQEVDMLSSLFDSFTGTNNVIFSLPSMNMRMTSDEDYMEGLRRLPYDFDSTFVRRGGQSNMENINITFNISLYSWLTVLRKTFTREIKRAQDISEWRVGNATVVAGRPRQGSTDLVSSPVSSNNDQPRSPARSRSSSRSRAPSPMRSKSVESVILSQPMRGQIMKSPVHLPKTASNEPAKLVDEINDEPAPLSQIPSPSDKVSEKAGIAEAPPKKSTDLLFLSRSRKIERLTVRQLGEATPDVMHPFFTKKAGFNLEESLPQYVHEYATTPIEEIMKGLLKLYSKQLD